MRVCKSTLHVYFIVNNIFCYQRVYMMSVQKSNCVYFYEIKSYVKTLHSNMSGMQVVQKDNKSGMMN